MKPKNRVFTPIDLFVQTYAMDHPRKYTYKPGADLEFDTHMMSQEDIEDLIEAVDKCGLRVQFNGQVFLYEPDEDEEPEEEHRAPTPEEVDAMDREAEKLAELDEALEPRPTPEELRAEADRIEEEMKKLNEEPVRTYEEIEASQDEEEAVEIEVDEEPEETLEI